MPPCLSSYVFNNGKPDQIAVPVYSSSFQEKLRRVFALSSEQPLASETTWFGSVLLPVKRQGLSKGFFPKKPRRSRKKDVCNKAQLAFIFFIPRENKSVDATSFQTNAFFFSPHVSSINTARGSGLDIIDRLSSQKPTTRFPLLNYYAHIFQENSQKRGARERGSILVYWGLISSTCDEEQALENDNRAGP